MRAVARAARRLVHERLLLEEAAERYVEAAEASNVLREFCSSSEKGKKECDER